MSWNAYLAASRARQYALMGAHEAAIDAWRDVLTEDPLDASAHAELAYSLFQRRRLAGARAEATRALELDAQLSTPLIVLALCDHFDNRRDRALARLEEALERDPFSIWALVIKAQFLSIAGRWAEARDAVKEALRVDPGHPAARLEQGVVARHTGDAARAREIARELVAEDPENVAALVLLGETARDTGDKEEAYRLALSALSVDATDPKALDLLAAVKLARNPVGGLFWHIALVLGRLGEKRLIWFAWSFYLVYMLINSTMAWYEVPQALQWIFILLYLSLGAGLWLNRKLIDRMVRRELRTFRIRPDY